MPRSRFGLGMKVWSRSRNEGPRSILGLGFRIEGLGLGLEQLGLVHIPAEKSQKLRK